MRSTLNDTQATSQPDFQSKWSDRSRKEDFMKLQRLRSIALTAAMATALSTGMLVAVPQLQAEDHAQCQRHIEHAEAKLDEAIRKHGERSHQAEQRRHDLNAERERCWNSYHGWWDGHNHQWHTDRDWDH
jgi:hypothetical protein